MIGRKRAFMEWRSGPGGAWTFDFGTAEPRRAHLTGEADEARKQALGRPVGVRVDRIAGGLPRLVAGGQRDARERIQETHPG